MPATIGAFVAGRGREKTFRCPVAREAATPIDSRRLDRINVAVRDGRVLIVDGVY
jgi:hypothetical protein